MSSVVVGKFGDAWETILDFTIMLRCDALHAWMVMALVLCITFALCFICRISPVIRHIPLPNLHRRRLGARTLGAG